MHIVKRIIHILSTSLLSVIAISGTLALALIMNFANKDVVTSWPRDTGVYDQITDIALLSITSGEGGESQDLDTVLNNGSINGEAIKQAVRDTFAPEFWQEQYESNVDSIFGWLEGEGPLIFNVSLQSKQTEFAGRIESVLESELKQLPACSAGQITFEFDPLRAECIPPNVSPEQAAQEVSQQIAGDNSFFSESFNQDDVQVSAQTQDQIKSYYQRLQQMAFILPLLLVLVTILVVITDSNYVKGLRKTGRTLFVVGTLSWISYYVALRLNNNFSIPQIGDGGAVESEIGNRIITPLFLEIIKDVTTTALWLGLVVVIYGGLLWLAGYIWHKTQHQHEIDGIVQRAMGTTHNTNSQTETLPKPVEPEDKPATPPPDPGISL